MTNQRLVRSLAVAILLVSVSLGYCNAPTADDYVAFFASEVGQWKWERHDGECGMTYVEMSPTKRFLTYYVTKAGQPYLNGVAGYDASAKGWKMTLFGIEDEGETVYTGITVLDKKTMSKMGEEKFEYTVSSKSVNAKGQIEESEEKVIVRDVDTKEYQSADGQLFLKTTRFKASDHVSALSKFIGKWEMEREATDERPGVSKGDTLSSTMEVQWILDKSAMNMSAVTASNGKHVSAVSGTVGWDPAEEVIISRGFRDAGGTAYSKWIPVGDDWHLIGYDIDSNGVKTTRVVVISDIKNDSFGVQTIDRVVDGEKEEDSPKGYWKREKAKQ